MGEKPEGNLIQELLETGLYTSIGVWDMLGTKQRKRCQSQHCENQGRTPDKPWPSQAREQEREHWKSPQYTLNNKLHPNPTWVVPWT